MTGTTTYNIVYAVILAGVAAIGLVRFLVAQAREERERRLRDDRQRAYRRQAMKTRYYG